MRERYNLPDNGADCSTKNPVYPGKRVHEVYGLGRNRGRFQIAYGINGQKYINRYTFMGCLFYAICLFINNLS